MSLENGIYVTVKVFIFTVHIIIFVVAISTKKTPTNKLEKSSSLKKKMKTSRNDMKRENLKTGK